MTISFQETFKHHNIIVDAKITGKWHFWGIMLVWEQRLDHPIAPVTQTIITGPKLQREAWDSTERGKKGTGESIIKLQSCKIHSEMKSLALLPTAFSSV